MRHHDHQPLPGDLPQDFHHLDAGFTVQRTGGLVRQQDFRIVHQRPGNRHPLHLSAAQLVGLLADLVRQPDLLQGFQRPAPPLFPADPAQGQRQLYVGQYRLVRNQVVALEHKSDRVVPVGIPVAFLKLLRALSADDQVAVGVLVQPADNIQQGGLSAAGRTQDRGKFAFSEFQVDSAQGMHLHFPAGINLRNLPECQHLLTFPRKNTYRQYILSLK